MKNATPRMVSNAKAVESKLFKLWVVCMNQRILLDYFTELRLSATDLPEASYVTCDNGSSAQVSEILTLLAGDALRKIAWPLRPLELCFVLILLY
jgi:hypothetical protein